MAFSRDAAPERFRNARQLNISIMIILGAGLSARTGNNSNIFLRMLRVLSGAFLGWALAKSPEFFSRLRSENTDHHDFLRGLSALSSFSLAVFSLTPQKSIREFKLTNTTRLGIFLTVFSLIGPEVLDTFAAYVASNKLTSGFAKYLAAGYTPPSGSTILSSETIQEFTPSLPQYK